jgi:hypothetical protein
VRKIRRIAHGIRGRKTISGAFLALFATGPIREFDPVALFTYLSRAVVAVAAMRTISLYAASVTNSEIDAILHVSRTMLSHSSIPTHVSADLKTRLQSRNSLDPDGLVPQCGLKLAIPYTDSSVDAAPILCPMAIKANPNDRSVIVRSVTGVLSYPGVRGVPTIGLNSSQSRPKVRLANPDGFWRCSGGRPRRREHVLVLATGSSMNRTLQQGAPS